MEQTALAKKKRKGIDVIIWQLEIRSGAAAPGGGGGGWVVGRVCYVTDVFLDQARKIVNGMKLDFSSQ